MALKIGSNTVVDNNRKGIFVGLNPGVFNNSNRPSHAAGKIIYNSDTGNIQVSNGSAWA